MEKESATALTFLDNLNEGVLIAKRDGVLLYANTAARMLLGLADNVSSLESIFPSNWQTLISPPAQIRLQTSNGRLLELEAQVHQDDLVQILVNRSYNANGNQSNDGLEHLSALTRISKESDFDKKLQRIVDGLQAIGWNRVILTLRDVDFQSTQLITAGFSEEEKETLHSNLIPSDIWLSLFEDAACEVFRHGDCYFVPAETEWSVQHLGSSGGIKSDDNFLWQPKDLLSVPLFDRQQKRIGLIGLDQPQNGRRPTPRTLETIELYAQFAASTIENAQLIDEAVARNREFEILFEANKAISGTLDKETILATMGQQMAQAIQADGYAIYQWDVSKQRVTVLQTAVTGRFMEEPDAHFTLTDDSPLLAIIRKQQSDTITNNQLYRPTWLDESITYTSVLLPIILAEETFGLIELFSQTPQTQIASHNLQLLVALANQASTVLETALVFEDIYNRERFYNALGRVSLAINFTLEQDTVLNLISSESLRIFDVDGAYIWQLKDDHLKGVAAHGHGSDAFLDSTIGLSDEKTFAITVAQSGEAQYVNHLRQANDTHIYLPDGESIEAVLGVPFEQDGRVTAVLILADKHNPDRFTDQDVTQATTFGVQVAIALQNANLFEELNKLNEELDSRVAQRTQELNEESERFKILLRITSELSASLDEDRVLKQALRMINEVVQATHGVIMLLDYEADEFTFRATLGMDEYKILSGKPSGLKRTEGLAGWIVENKTGVIIHDTNDDPRWLTKPNNYNHRSVIGVPLISNEEVIGVLMMYHAEPNSFTNSQLALVEAAAIQVSSAINNANLYLLIRDQAERLGSLLRTEQVEAAKSQAILESIADGVIVANEMGNIILANHPASNILELSRNYLLGKTVKELVGLYGHAGDDWITTIADWAAESDRIQQGTFLAEEFETENKVISVRLSPVMSGRQFFGTVSIFRDITKEKEVERLKTDFVSTVSHELRTPMTSIKGYVDLMLMGATGTMSEGQSRYLQVIKTNADRLHMLVNDLLDISKIETGKAALDIRPIDVTQIIEQVANDHLQGRIQHENKAIQIMVENAPSLPLAHGDQSRVTQVLTNLVDNAFNYTPENGQITIKSWKDNTFVNVSVIDTGIGISKKNLDKIFDRFYRSDHADVQKVSGTGLGLAIVRSLVEMQGGTLKVESTLGTGSNFTFSLPVVLEDSDAN